MSQKYAYLTPDILVEWNYSEGNVSETYSKLTDLTTNKTNFISTSNDNDLNHTLFSVDSVIRKYAKVDTDKFNILQLQSYSSPPIEYDKVKIHLPTTFDFGDNIGFIFSVYTYDYNNENYIYFSDFYYDISDPVISKSINYQTPFVYGEKEWNRNLTINIPSLNDVSNQRQVSSTGTTVIPFTINANMSSNGISTTAPIILDFRFITGKETILGTTYYYSGDKYSRSIPKTPEFESLGVVIEESVDWDFFQIYGIYKGSNENMDDFVYAMNVNGRKINIEYTITLYEENVQSGYPTKIKVTDNFSQKLDYRPIFKYSNTTAAIDVQMDILDLGDFSTITRRTSIGLTKNLFKYGKKLSQLTANSVYRPNIYNYKPSSNFSYDTTKNATSYEITKVPYPVLIEKYKVLVNSSNSTNTGDNEFLSNGLLNLLLTPFDNILKFQIYQREGEKTPEPYDLNSVTTYGEIMLVFKSDNESIEKSLFYETGDNQLEYGTIVFKILENDILVLKQIVKSGFNNFYIVVKGHKTKTMIYSGKFNIMEDVKYIKYAGSSWSPYIPQGTTTGSTDNEFYNNESDDNFNAGSNSSLSTVNIQSLYNQILSLQTELELERAVNDNNQFERDNITDITEPTPVGPIALTPAEIFQNSFNNKNSEYANYILFTIPTNLSGFINIVNRIKTQYTGLGISANNVYYYDNNYSLIILQGIKKSVLSQYAGTNDASNFDTNITEILELSIGFGLTNTYQEYNQNITPIANFTMTPSGPEYTTLDTVDFTNTSTNVFDDLTTYMWYYTKDGSTTKFSESKNTSLMVRNSGSNQITYKIKLVVDNNGLTNSIEKTIVVLPDNSPV